MSMYKEILGNRSLRILGIAESVSSVGNWITMMAVFAMVVFQGEGTVVQSSGVFLAGLLPTLLFSPLAGWLSDRIDRKWLMMGSEFLSGLFISGLIFVDRLEFIYGLLVLQAISMSIMTPARQASVPDVVAREDLSQANAFLQQLAGLIKIGAPVLAGALLAVINPHQAIILDVISFGLSVAILSRLPSLSPHKEAPLRQAQETPQGEAGVAAPPMRTLVSLLKDSWSLRFLFVLAFLAVFVIIGFDVLSSIFVRDVLDGEEGLYGLLISLVGLGTVGSTVLLMARKRAAGQWRDVVVGLALLAAIPASLALSSALGQPRLGRALVAASSLLGGVGNGLINVQAGTLLQLLSPAALLGRVSGLFQSTVVAAQLAGMLVIPILVPGVLSIGVYFFLSAVLLTLVVLYAAFALRRAGPQPAGGPAGVEGHAGQAA
jgi:DHA3 family macrolide efflux protein-like MFS transporter